jgi:DNA-binding GntR family transcriptional regulator
LWLASYNVYNINAFKIGMMSRSEAPTQLPGKTSASSGLRVIAARSLSDQIADAIVEGVAVGALEPGQRLVEIELAQRLSVSRVPLREALKILEAQGILERTPHRGARLVELDDGSIDQVCEARVALETIAARHAMAAFRIDRSRAEPLERVLQLLERAVRDGDWPAVNTADLAFHREICRASNNDIVTILWEALARHVRMIFGREILGEKEQTQIVQQHRDLYAFLLAGDAAALAEMIEGHIMRLRRRLRTAPPPIGRALDQG